MKTNSNELVLVTGSSGFVASRLIPDLSENYTVIGLDLLAGEYTEYVVDIGSASAASVLSKFSNQELTLVNLAAARFDYGALAPDYYEKNVTAHANFLELLGNLDIKKLIHVSSVASIDGESIPYSDLLSCDDAYRSTKYLQEQMIIEWCDKHGIGLSVLYPSAIFEIDARSDTNVGKLQQVAKFIPFIPKIDVVKSLTYLPYFSSFIISLLSGKVKCGKYLTIERPSITVTEMLYHLTDRKRTTIRIPFLRQALMFLSYALNLMDFSGKRDFKLTPNRVVKLFSDTSYTHLKNDDVTIDVRTYSDGTQHSLPEILTSIVRK